MLDDIPPMAEPPFDDDRREDQRLAALDRLDILDTPPEEAFDRITRLVRSIFGVPIALVSLIDGHRQWNKSCNGIGITEVPKRQTFCRYTIARKEPLIIRDTKADPLVAGSPHVVGEPFIRFYAGIPLCTPDGQNVGTLCAVDFKPRAFGEREIGILRDLAAVVMDEIELRQLAADDALTGVLSRRAFMEQAGRAFLLAKRHGHALSCLAIDVDRFKSINDAFGHAGGDKVLADVAQACAGAIRDSDTFGRIGGEEFAAIVHAGRAGALETAERIRDRVAGLVFDGDLAGLSVTTSVGVATLDMGLPALAALMQQADAALYEAKRTGRDRCVVWRSAQEIRDAAPRRVLKAGQIVFGNGTLTVDCTIRSLGREGAGIDVSSTVGIPDRFTLLIRSEGLEQPCRVLSRTERHLEVVIG